MISGRTIELLEFIFRILRFFPFPLSFDSITCRMSEIRRDGPFSITIWRFVYWFLFIFESIGGFLVGILLTTDPIPSMHEVVIHVCFECMTCLALIILYTTLTRAQEIELMLNRFFEFDEKFRERFNVQRVPRDGTEWLTISLLGMLFVMPFFEFPAFLFMTLNTGKLMNCLLTLTRTRNVVTLAYATSTFLTIIGTIHTISISGFVFSAILTQNLMIKWLEERNFKVTLESKLAYPTDSEIFYRSLQLLHVEVLSCVEIAAPACQVLATVILIVIPFSIINFWSWLDKYTVGLLSMIAVAAFVLFFILTSYFSQIWERSRKFPVSHAKSLNPCFLRSCQPLRWKMGTSYYITRNSFLTLLKNFVIKAIIKLVLTF